MRMNVRIGSDDFIFIHPETQGEFDAIAALNGRVHGEGVAALARVLRDGAPGMGPEDWYGLFDPSGERCLSTLCRIPATWSLNAGRDGGPACELPVAELGLVATDEGARGDGLSSWLMKRFLADSKERGYLLSSIQGIPYFYRRFGYEYAVPLLMGVRLSPELTAGLGTPPSHRPASAEDLPLLKAWFDESQRPLELRAERDDPRWAFLTGEAQKSPETAVERLVLLDESGAPAGYLGVQNDCFGPTLAVVEGWQGGIAPEAALALAEKLRAERGLPHVTSFLDRGHPVSAAAQALGGELWDGYGWQMSVLDPPAFMAAAAPVYASRLKDGGFSGVPARLALDFYGSSCLLSWDGETLFVGRHGRDYPVGEPIETADHGDTPEARVPPELLAPLALGFRRRDEIACLRFDLGVPKASRPFFDAIFKPARGFVYPLY